MSQKGVTVGETDFPPYTVQTFGEGYLLVAGGGGQAKTGVANVVEIYELSSVKGLCALTKLKRQDIGERAVMNSALMEHDKVVVLAVGLDQLCSVYLLRRTTVKTKDDVQDIDGVRRRKSNLTQSADHDNAPSVHTFDFEPLKEVQTDNEYQKVVGFGQIASKKQSFLVTGGAQGKLLLWKYPDLTEASSVQAHTGEIDDLDVSPQGNRVTTVSKDGKACIWSTKNMKLTKHCDLVWPKKTDTKYRYRSCRSGVVIDKKDQYCLYTTHIPVQRGKKADPCYLTKWDTSKYSPTRIRSTGTEILSAMAISDTGTYLGLGTISGSVSVHIAFSLQRLYHVKECHKIFVTGLDFMPSTRTLAPVTGKNDFTLFSISADSQIKIHQQEQRVMFSILWAVVGFIVVIYLFFWGFAALGL